MQELTLEQLTRDIREKHTGAENRRLVEKWNRTGLLMGLGGRRMEDMARLLENQAAQALREANSISTGGAANTSSGDIRGFTSIAFPIVRRVFGGLVANELVSIQPMSLPSGLLFYLDYTYGNNVGGDYDDDGTAIDSGTDSVYTAGQSIYNNPTGRGVQSGSLATGGQYDLVGTGFTKVHKHLAFDATYDANNNVSGAFNGASAAFVQGGTVASSTQLSGANPRHLSHDPQVLNDVTNGVLDCFFLISPTSDWTGQVANGDVEAVSQLAITNATSTTGLAAWGQTYQGGSGILNLRRLTKRGDFDGTNWTDDALGGTHFLTVLRLTNGSSIPNMQVLTGSMVINDTLSATDDSSGSTLVVPSFESDFGTSPTPVIPEIDIKVESIAVTATSRKLRARWSPELAQDLNAYHSMDAEVELTQILSEQVALEIDREILGDLLTQANGANLYWSRAPGKFVNKETGAEISLTDSLSPGPAFTGTIREWYESLVETVIDVGNTIHRKTLRGSANFIVVSPDVATILESSLMYKADYTVDGDGQVAAPFSLGCEKIGTLTNRMKVYKDPYFPRNKILVGYKGGSYLESGYVYAPYVPLIVTPTIFAPEDFTPRKGVMTRYGKKMVRSDFFGTVTVLDLNIIFNGGILNIIRTTAFSNIPSKCCNLVLSAGLCSNH
jgi:hypothetical protein